MFNSFFLFLVMFSSVMIFSCESYVMVWVLMEINLMSFVSYLVFSLFKENKGESLQYLFIQSSASMVFLVSSVLSFSSNSMIFLALTPLALLTKLGAAPFHFWFFKIVSSLSWDTFFIISSIQKIIPLIMLTKLDFYLFFFSMLSALISSVGVFFSNNFKMMLAYSSLFNLSWMLAINPQMSLSFLFLLLYMLNLSILLWAAFSSDSFNNKTLIAESAPISNLSLVLPFLSMGGLPPMVGFFAKVVSLCYLVHISVVLSVTLLLLSGLILFMYIRFSFNYWKIFWMKPLFFFSFSSFPTWSMLMVPLLMIF